MPYNPGISYRGEILGQSIGAAGQSIAQSYGQGLRLQEEQKRYDDVMKQRRRDRKQLKRSLGMQAELLGVDKEDIDTMGLGELQGFVEGTKLKTSLDYQGLQLQQLEDDIAQTAAGKRAIGQMQMYMEEQNLDPVEAATSAARDEGLELGEAAKLLNLATTGQKLGLELRSIQAREEGLALQKAGHEIALGTLGVQQGQLGLAEKQQKRLEEQDAAGPKARDVEGAPGYKVVDMGGGRTQLVQTGQPDPVAAAEARVVDENITSKADTAYAEADQIARGGGEELKEIKGGDERTGLGASRYNRLAKQYASLDSLNKQHRARTGQDHPKYKEFMDRVAPLVQHMREQGRSQDDLQKILQSIGFKRTYNQMKQEGRDKEAKEFAEKFGVNPER